MNENERKVVVRRMLLLIAVACIIMGLYTFRLIFLQLVNGDDFIGSLSAAEAGSMEPYCIWVFFQSWWEHGRPMRRMWQRCSWPTGRDALIWHLLR